VGRRHEDESGESRRDEDAQCASPPSGSSRGTCVRR
jgi:hypothetical protein